MSKEKKIDTFWNLSAHIIKGGVKPCPFCGSILANFYKRDDHSQVRVQHWCNDNGFATRRGVTVTGRDLEHALELWNTRKAQDGD